MLDFGIIASTANTEYSIKVQYETQKASNQVFDGIENINLGLYEREQPDIAVVKDIQSVKVVANNKEHVYEYANRFKNMKERYIKLIMKMRSKKIIQQDLKFI